MANNLYRLRYAHLHSKADLLALKQRILVDRPAVNILNRCTQLAQINVTNERDESNNSFYNVEQQSFKRQRCLTDDLCTQIYQTECRIDECRMKFNEAIQQSGLNVSNGRHLFTTEMQRLIYKRFDIIMRKIKCINEFQYRSIIQRMDHRLMPTKKFRTTENRYFLSSLFIDARIDCFDDQQLRLLMRGPTYVPVSFTCIVDESATDDDRKATIEHLCKPLRQGLNKLFEKFRMNMAQSMFIQKDIKDLYRKAFTVAIEKPIKRRILYEQMLVESIRQELLNESNIIIRRVANNRNMFYMGNRDEFEAKSKEFMNTGGRFYLCHSLENNDAKTIIDYVETMVKSYDRQLEDIIRTLPSNKELASKCLLNVNMVKLSYVYFLPDISDVSYTRIRLLPNQWNRDRKGDDNFKETDVSRKKKQTNKLFYVFCCDHSHPHPLQCTQSIDRCSINNFSTSSFCFSNCHS